VLHSWSLAGYGIAWRSTWEVESDIAAGRLVAVLEEFLPPRPTAFTLCFRSASTCRCAYACGSISSSTTTANPTSGARNEKGLSGGPDRPWRVT
jgi:hypothetical protein